ncbi:metallophosphoesterase [Neisseria chenwenguii]|uniref:metallophosphoesterase n=1 Tax=Neisseria chenwenguii TaxID=1853278 RepID=UPI000F500772|nr:metallophosphoesterase [Neisseria chenwenguii]ROV57440.1 metallophosphoesterase [Neisseria chenwenguii]
MRIAAFILTLILLQVFTFGLGRSLQWLFAPFTGRKTHRWLMAGAYLLTNGLIAGIFTALFFQTAHWAFRAMAFWMVALLFAAYAALATFVLYLLLRKFMAQPPLSRALRVFAPLFFIGLAAFAVFNAYVPTVRHASVTINKKMAKPLRIGMASDMHFGVLFGARQMDKLAGIMAQEKVDIILLPGDLMDDNVDAYLKENMRPHLEKLRAPLGVYATLGNHDLFGHQAEIRREVEKAGITVLANEAVEKHGLLLVGRNDEMDTKRPPADEILRGKNTGLPVLLMDHRPTSIDAHAKLPVDIQVSGHVHNGQVAPANFIVAALYDLAYGYKQQGNGHYFVSSGYGFWGVPTRLGSRSEVWIIDVEGK